MAVLYGDQNEVEWDENKPLIWKHFKGKVPQKKTSQVAMTHVSFHCSMETKNSILLTHRFVKDKSWVKKDKKLPRILIHEQYHFNISEVFARRMRRELSKLTIPSGENVQAIFDEWMKKYREEQELYDKETSHSKIKASQLSWQEKIDRELKELEAFKAQVVYLNQ